MDHREGYVNAADGTLLYHQSWHPDAPPRAVVIVCHGVADHGGRYPHLVARLVAEGYAVCAMDYRGHGRSGGPRLHVNDGRDYRRDLDVYLRHVAAAHPDVPYFLFGHSMGSIVALECLLERPGCVSGMISSGTALLAGKGFSPLLLALNRLLDRLAPRLRLISLPREGLSRDRAWVRRSNADPLIHQGPGTVRLGNAILDAQARVRARLSEIRVPLLVVHGAADLLVDPASAALLCEGATSPDKTLRLYAGASHEVHNDLPAAREALLADVVAWLDAHGAPGSLSV